MIIILLGLPGSGKGTQSQFLVDNFKMYHISTGDLIRKMITANSDDSMKLSEYINLGKLVPDDMINNLVKKFFEENYQNKHYLLDGYPRTIEQANFLSEIVKTEYIVIYLQINEEIITKRISGRFNCSDCGKIYNEWYDQLLAVDVCNICQGKNFIRRKDDDPNIVLKRITEHKKELLPLVEYYRKLNFLHIIDANENKEKISLEIMQILKMI